MSDYWQTFPKAYRDAVRQFEQTGQFTLRLSEGQGLDVRPPLHPNARLLLATIAGLAPRMVLEVGSGSGDNLHNLTVLLPGLEAFGLDWMPEQVAFALERSPDMADRIWQADIADPRFVATPTYDVVFTHAVLMHLEGRVETGIRNALGLSHRYFVGVENWTSNKALDLLRASPGWRWRMVSGDGPEAIVMERL